MLDARINEWRSRLLGNGPWLVSALFAILIAIEVARSALALLGGEPARPLAVTGASALLSAGAPFDAQRIVAAHLFGVAPLDATTQNPADAPPAGVNWTLAGTISTGDPKHGLAIVAADGPSKVYSVGDRIGAATLYAVYPDRIVLYRGGSLSTLRMPLQFGAGPAPSLPMQNTTTVQRLNRLRQIVERNPSLLNTVLRAVPSYDSRAGRLRGFRIYPGVNRPAFAALGLRPGDLVTAVDGTPLDDPQRGQMIFDTIQSSDRAVVTVDRGGQTLNLTLNIAKVTAEATRDLAAPAKVPLRAPPRIAAPNLND
ncbi:MAG TPA: type II secretion system protein N [Steroidobacteraceae bacterium]|nr:type II secretion system protein N [Steroidobacteraceae bacterium]